MFVIRHFERARVRKFSPVPEEGIMPKQSHKSLVTRTCALACVAGLSLNSFAIANGAARRSPGSARTSSAARGPESLPEPTPTPDKPGMTPAKENMSTQIGQGRQYGQSGFMGEPINLNVVNADIRDILNYITEQYGINFVIDSSVGAVPVTVNVQDVPWNYALDALLRANRLGVEVNGKLLRVETSDTLAQAAQVQNIISDAPIDNSALVTEFVRLNYARAVGTLAQAAGSTGGYAGGATNLSFSGGAG